LRLRSDAVIYGHVNRSYLVTYLRTSKMSACTTYHWKGKMYRVMELKIVLSTTSL